MKSNIHVKLLHKESNEFCGRTVSGQWTYCKKRNIEGNERNLKFRAESISWEILFTVKGVG